MSTTQLPNDEVLSIPIVVLDADGAVVPAPAGDVFTVVSSDPTKLGAVVGVMPAGPLAGHPAVAINALIQASTPGVLSITVSDSAGLAIDTMGVDIVADTTPKAIGLDLTDAQAVPQPVPTNPGP